jgi:hypothetical protein
MNTIKHILHTWMAHYSQTEEAASVKECNYADNYYGDRACKSSDIQ